MRAPAPMAAWPGETDDLAAVPTNATPIAQMPATAYPTPGVWPGGAWPTAGYAAMPVQSTRLPAPRPGAEPAKGALASMWLGIAAVLVLVLAPILGILAIVMGSRARKRIMAGAGAFSGAGHALAGRVLGWASLGLIPIVGIIFVITIAVSGIQSSLVDADGARIISDHITSIPPGSSINRGFIIYAAHVTNRYTVEAGGLNFTSAIYPVDDASHPTVTSEKKYGSYAGPLANETVRLSAGSYALKIRCDATTTCFAHYTIRLIATP